jgi:uncharacterized BrkB/YihY/UPF0761 family membrane protein
VTHGTTVATDAAAADALGTTGHEGGRSPDVPDDTAAAQRRGLRGRIDTTRTRFGDLTASFTGWLDRRRVEAVPYDLAVTFYERDRDTFASVLGAALAMRLFLFLVPFLAFAVGAVIAIFGSAGIDTVLQGSSVTGTIAAQIRSATETTRAGGLALMASGIFLSLWAGRSLTRVLAACSAGAWRITGRASRATLRMAGTVTALVTLLVLLLAFMNRVREDFSLPFATTSWIATAVLMSVAWFVVSWSLPRATSDPGALLPGAALTGLTLTGLQWVMQYYLPGRIERASDLTGSLGVTLAALGYLFLIGRVMASSLILNAVVWERLGSITGLVFGLPVLRRIPERSPRFARFFDLDRRGDTADPPVGASIDRTNSDPPATRPVES